jgi:hypothetical protein
MISAEIQTGEVTMGIEYVDQKLVSLSGRQQNLLISLMSVVLLLFNMRILSFFSDEPGPACV